jgi:uncharacterized protein YcbX
MTFQELLNSPVFFNTFIKNDTFFNSLKDKFPEIFADLTSSKNNPNCSCKNRVKAHLQSKIESEKDYFNSLLTQEDIINLINEKQEEVKNTQIPMNLINPMMHPYKNSGGKVFEIGKTEEDWKNLCKRLEIERVSFRSFSIVEKEDKLVVYFI